MPRVDDHARFEIGRGIHECTPELRTREVQHQNTDIDAVILAQPVRDRPKCLRAPRDQDEMHAAFGELGRERRAKTLPKPLRPQPSRRNAFESHAFQLAPRSCSGVNRLLASEH